MTELTPKLWAIEVPIDAAGFNLSNNVLYYSPPAALMDSFITLPEDQWKLIGLIWEDGMDFDPTPYVEYMTATRANGKGQFNYGVFHKNYVSINNFLFNNATDSFRSLLASKNLHWVNPLEEEPNHINYSEWCINEIYKYDLANWQQAENALIKGKLVIVEKL